MSDPTERAIEMLFTATAPQQIDQYFWEGYESACDAFAIILGKNTIHCREDCLKILEKVRETKNSVTERMRADDLNILRGTNGDDA